MDVTKIISWLPFNESTTQDLLGGTWTANGNPTIEDGALKLDGSSYLQRTEQFEFTGQPFTVICKFSATSNTTGSTVCPWQMHSGGSNRIQLEIYPSGKLALWKDSDSTVYIQTAASVLDGQIHHAECDFDGATWYLFLDGTLIGTKAHTGTARDYSLYVGINYQKNGKFTGTIDEFMILDGVALHTENFTPPTNSDYADWQVEVAGYAPVKISFDVETYLRNAQKGWRVYNPGEAELLDTKGATTVEVPYTQSVTGKAFYGGTLSDMFHTPAGLKEIWIRFDAVHFPVYEMNHSFDLYAGHWSKTLNKVIGIHRRELSYVNVSSELNLINTRIAYVVSGALTKYLLHIKSDATDGLVELTVDKDTYTQTGNINGGEDLNNIVFYTSGEGTYFSNIVVSETELTFADGWHRDSFGVETKINAPVLNVRLQGSNVKFPLSTKRKSNSLTVRVGDKKFYNTSVATSSSLAGAARYLLDDEARALSTSAT